MIIHHGEKKTNVIRNKYCKISDKHRTGNALLQWETNEKTNEFLYLDGLGWFFCMRPPVQCPGGSTGVKELGVPMFLHISYAMEN